MIILWKSNGEKKPWVEAEKKELTNFRVTHAWWPTNKSIKATIISSLLMNWFCGKSSLATLPWNQFVVCRFFSWWLKHLARWQQKIIKTHIDLSNATKWLFFCLQIPSPVPFYGQNESKLRKIQYNHTPYLTELKCENINIF